VQYAQSNFQGGFAMSKKIYLLIGAIMVLVVGLAAACHSIAQTRTSSNDATKLASLPTRMFVRGYTGYPDDLEHCFVQDHVQGNTNIRRPLYFDAYVDKPVKDAQIDLKLYTFANGTPALVIMDPGDWSVDYNSGNKFTIKIKEDAHTRPPHLGPGPYMALIPISSMTKGASYFTGYYYYGTWLPSSSPLDCWSH
jgi:hypothetical protein